MARSKIQKEAEMKIVIASSSQEKIGALKAACDRLKISAEIIRHPAASGVNEQPYGLEETLTGAMIRADTARSFHKDKIVIGIENGLIPCGACFIDLASLVLVKPDGETYIGTSTGISFPTDAVKVAERRGFSKNTAGSVIAEMYGGTPSDPHRTLTAGAVSRKEILTDALVALLSRASIC